MEKDESQQRKSGKQFKENDMKLTKELLIKNGFAVDEKGLAWKSVGDVHSIGINASDDGFFYPFILEEPEFAHQDEQSVSVKRISTLTELFKIIDIIA